MPYKDIQNQKNWYIANADFSELRFNINNGITMKKEIHKLFHKIYGKKNNTKEQIEKFAEDLFFNPSNDYIIHS
jgi:hypothetical protein